LVKATYFNTCQCHNITNDLFRCRPKSHFNFLRFSVIRFPILTARLSSHHYVWLFIIGTADKTCSYHDLYYALCPYSGTPLHHATISRFTLCTDHIEFCWGICLTINKLGQKTLYKNYLLINRLYNESITDGLTKLNNKRAFQEQIERLNAIASRDEVSLGLVFVDADYFKAVNDTFGHRAGDDVLKKIAQVVDAKCRRSTDMGFRIGGDEFALILYGVNQAVLENTCREIVKDVADFHLKVNRENIKTSVSVGAILKSNSAKITSTKLIELADEYLYQAKKNGRNQFDLSVFQPA